MSVNPNQTNTVTTAKRTSTTKVPTKQRRFSYNIDEKDIESGAEAIDKFKVTNHAGLEIKYAWVSQRGYYPDGNALHFYSNPIIILRFESTQSRIKTIKTATQSCPLR